MSTARGGSLPSRHRRGAHVAFAGLRVLAVVGRHGAATIKRRFAGDAGSRPFRYRDCGSLATISRFRAFGSIGRLRIAGFPAWLLWLLVHLVWLTWFKNRVLVLAYWTIAFLSRGRAERAITEQQVFGRQALAPSVPGGEVVD